MALTLSVALTSQIALLPALAKLIRKSKLSPVSGFMCGERQAQRGEYRGRCGRERDGGEAGPQGRLGGPEMCPAHIGSVGHGRLRAVSGGQRTRDQCAA